MTSAILKPYPALQALALEEPSRLTPLERDELARLVRDHQTARRKSARADEAKRGAMSDAQELERELAQARQVVVTEQTVRTNLEKRLRESYSLGLVECLEEIRAQVQAGAELRELRDYLERHGINQHLRAAICVFVSKARPATEPEVESDRDELALVDDMVETARELSARARASLSPAELAQYRKLKGESP